MKIQILHHKEYYLNQRLGTFGIADPITGCLKTNVKYVKRKRQDKNKMEHEKVDIEVKGEIELPSIDVSKYVGKKVPIESVETMKGQHGYFVKVETLTVETLEAADKDIEIKGSRIFGLQEDTEGNIGWGKDTKLGLFLKKMGVTHFNKLVGVDVVLQTTTSKEGKDFLSFN